MLAPDRSIAILRLERVTKRYGQRVVLREVEHEFFRGTFTLVQGANGSGKTTLLRLLSSYARPTSGTVQWYDAEERELIEAEAARRLIGYVGHQPLIYDELTGREQVEFQLRIRGFPKKQIRGEAHHWLDAFGLGPQADERSATFSRGTKQRLALAQAFAPRPPILLLDEPFSNLDSRSQEMLRSAMEQMRKTSLFVVASHEPGHFRDLADHVLEIRDQTLHPGGPG